MIVSCAVALLAALYGISCDAQTYQDIRELPIVTTVYWPDAGGINCDDDCSRLADGMVWSRSDYDVVAACPMALFGLRVHIVGMGTVHCRDSGPSVVVRWSEELKHRVVFIDVLRRVGDSAYNYHVWNMWYVTNE